MSSRPPGSGRPSPGNLRKLKDLLLKSDNRTCADCGAPDPKWASANIGVFLCLKCCGVHRSLGTHISKVLSVTLDDWSDEEIDSMIEVGGNSAANSIYEAFIPEGVSKPGPESSHEQRAKFIRSKYELQEFLKPSLRIVSLNTGRSSLQSSFSRKIIDTFRSSDSSKKTDGMVEFIGLVKVKVIKGTNMAIRDMLSSDPYVVLTLGQQRVQTKVIQSNLNPIWNEELMLSVPQRFGAIKLFDSTWEPSNKVYCFDSQNGSIRISFMRNDSILTTYLQNDWKGLAATWAGPLGWGGGNEGPERHLSNSRDSSLFRPKTFSKRDRKEPGIPSPAPASAEIDIQPLITSATAFGDAGMFTNMQIGKWLKSHDNALISDSIINIIDGKVKQEISLKLQNVESGEIDLEVEWMPLDQ
ncbi:C2 calcium-dependent membrane targeting [Macleaya cordata]|uniref:C2 calcium-dependent membrane targeting n=1 Tax=Macleaya cordata TaxID=56857 RepID=A0A200Q336_MACCD|nr:C2 calcium-dependent membrane targeting [Macleaya cordata]